MEREQSGRTEDVRKLLGNMKTKFGKKTISAPTKRISRALKQVRPSGSFNEDKRCLSRLPSLIVSDYGEASGLDEDAKNTPPQNRRGGSPSLAHTGTAEVVCNNMTIEEWKKRIQTAIVTDSQNMLQEYLKGFNMELDTDFTFLHLAVFNRKDGCARKLLRNQSKVNAVDDVRKTPLHYATINNNPSMVCLLIKHGAKCDIIDDEDMTPIMHAAQLGLDFCLRELLVTSNRKDVRMCNKEGKTAIHYAAQNDDMGCLKLLLRHCTPQDLNVQDNNQETPLHLACLGKHTRNVQCLLESAANPFIHSKDHLMPVHYSACLWDTATLKVMLGSQDFDINVQDKSGKTLLHLAAASNPTHGEGSRAQYECVEYLLEFDALEVDLWDVTKTSALGYAAEHDSSLTNLLLQAGADVNGRDIRVTKDYKIGFVPPLHRAVESNQPDNVLLLVNSGAAVNMRDSYGRTALHIATAREFEKCMKVLLRSGANTNVKDKHDQSPIQIAIENNNPQLVQIILQHAMQQVPSIWAGSEKAFKINLGCLLPSDDNPESHLLKMINETFRDENKRDIFLLPVTRAYLDLKMKCLNHLELLSVLLTLLFLLLAMLFLFNYGSCLFSQNKKGTTFSLMSHGTGDDVPDDCSSLTSGSFIWWYVWMTILPIYALYKIVELIAGLTECLSRIESYLDMVIISSSFFLSPWSPFSFQGQKVFVIMVIIFSGLNFMLTLGSVFTFWNIQIMMFRKVFQNISIMMMAFAPLIFCFVFSIHSILQKDDGHSNLFYSFVSSLTYAVGGIRGLSIVDGPEENRVALSIICLLFVILIIAVIMNLLIGVAVNVTEGLGKYGLYRALQRKLTSINQKERMLAMFRLVKSTPFSLEKKLGPEVSIKVAAQPLKHLDIISQLWFKCCALSGSFSSREVWPLSWVGLTNSDIQTVDEFSRKARKCVQVMPKSRYSMTFVEEDGAPVQTPTNAYGDMDSVAQNLGQLQKKMMHLETLLLKIQNQMDHNKISYP